MRGGEFEFLLWEILNDTFFFDLPELFVFIDPKNKTVFKTKLQYRSIHSEVVESHGRRLSYLNARLLLVLA